jgi:hypothetical protein
VGQDLPALFEKPTIEYFVHEGTKIVSKTRVFSSRNALNKPISISLQFIANYISISILYLKAMLGNSCQKRKRDGKSRENRE